MHFRSASAFLRVRAEVEKTMELGMHAVMRRRDVSKSQRVHSQELDKQGGDGEGPGRNDDAERRGNPAKEASFAGPATAKRLWGTRSAQPEVPLLCRKDFETEALKAAMDRLASGTQKAYDVAYEGKDPQADEVLLVDFLLHTAVNGGRAPGTLKMLLLIMAGFKKRCAAMPRPQGSRHLKGGDLLLRTKGKLYGAASLRQADEECDEGELADDDCQGRVPLRDARFGRWTSNVYHEYIWEDRFGPGQATAGGFEPRRLVVVGVSGEREVVVVVVVLVVLVVVLGVVASCLTINEVPGVNAIIDDGTKETVWRDYVDISIPIPSPRGIIACTLRDAQSMSIRDMEHEIAGLTDRAARDELCVEDLSQSTFGIVDAGIAGGMLGTGIINFPQSASMGTNAVKKRVTVVEGKVEARPIMFTSLTYDHRLVDGREAVTFLCNVRDKLQDPARMLLDLCGRDAAQEYVGVRNSANQQMILRTCEAVGIQEVWLVPPPSGAKYRATMVRSRHASRGAERFLTLRRFANVEEVAACCKVEARELWASYCPPRTEVSAAVAVPLVRGSVPSPLPRLALVLGTEGEGISPELLGKANLAVYLPMHGFMQSLNVAVACGMLLQRLFDLCPQARGDMPSNVQEHLAAMLHGLRLARDDVGDDEGVPDGLL
ncbi:Dihydrolipoyllysine-residue succinyltransferase component of 2-oxoglutarate dehydrogenase complex, mitochondrial [Symbiodinium microadriaticum]|uniref:dihydrolipoyllysine-residue succinyltransferase n=1 Tax=Symbiodinium microadriaticum TaxID=2951 RepID=A0A1Q9CY71_SYMMI|nr:Dihydrolipoyllysine-residue succinyltransferase component of 2-oxoglutarate dehydrogenase complex, mitochondrial [Symbiodinium microadriaticum]